MAAAMMIARNAAGLTGTSHRMLNYHFGSRNGLLTAIVSESERRQREFMASALLDRDATPGELMWRMWEQVADERLWPYERLFFEMSGRALQGDPDAQALRAELVDPWLESVDALAAQARAAAGTGAGPSEAGDRRDARPAARSAGDR